MIDVLIAALDDKSKVVFGVIEVMLRCGATVFGGCVREFLALYLNHGGFSIKDIDVNFPSGVSYNTFRSECSSRGWAVHHSTGAIHGSMQVFGFSIDVDFCIGELASLFPQCNGQVDFDVNNSTIIRLQRSGCGRYYNANLSFRDPGSMHRAGLSKESVNAHIRNNQFVILQERRYIHHSPSYHQLFVARVEKMEQRGWRCLNREVLNSGSTWGFTSSPSPFQPAHIAVVPRIEPAHAPRAVLSSPNQQPFHPGGMVMDFSGPRWSCCGASWYAGGGCTMQTATNNRATWERQNNCPCGRMPRELAAMFGCSSCYSMSQLGRLF